MTASIVRRPSKASAVVVAAAATIAIAALGLFGLTSIGLAIGFPLSVAVVEQFGLVVPARDLALAQQVAQFSWVFAVVAAAAFIAAMVTLVKVVEVLDGPRQS